jgi:hypothetical protein
MKGMGKKTYKNMKQKETRTEEDLNLLDKLRKFLLDFLEDEDVKIILFGSRARGDFINVSDVDIGIIVGKGFDRRKLILLRECIEEFNIPYKVEIVDLSEVSEEFKQTALREAIIWKD